MLETRDYKIRERNTPEQPYSWLMCMQNSCKMLIGSPTERLLRVVLTILLFICSELYIQESELKTHRNSFGFES